MYISLFPPSLYYAIGKDKTKDMLGTPSKMPSVLKHSRTANIPTPAATEAAVRLLTNFALTNTPQSLLRALRCYPLSDNEKRIIGLEFSKTYSDYKDSIDDSESENENEYSEIARQAFSITGCKSCWELLKEGTVKWEETKDKRKQPRQRRNNTSFTNYDIDDDNTTNLIEDNAWPMLQWLLRLFQKEEDIVSIILFSKVAQKRHIHFKLGSSIGSFSPSLLCHIKPNHSATSARSDVVAPLDVVFASYMQTDLARQQLGASLMKMVRIYRLIYVHINKYCDIQLIHLAESKLLSASDLLTSTVSRLRSQEVAVISSYLADLSSEGSQLFKIVLCDRYLVDSLGGGNSSRAGRKPHATRVKPSQLSDANPINVTAIAAAKSSSQSTIAPWVLPNSARVIETLNSRTSGARFLHDLFQYHLLLAYGSYKALEYANRSALNSIDANWESFMEEGFEGCHYFSAFPSQSTAEDRMKNELEKMRETATAAIQTWRAIMRVQR